jgi:hypothetical protein
VTPVRTAALLLLPPVLLASTVAVFHGSARRLGVRRGYLVGFLFYWGVWGLLVPLWIVGPAGLRRLYGGAYRHGGAHVVLDAACLALPPALAAAYVLPRQRARATPRVVLASAGLALVNATVEEVLWRGTYTASFPENVGLGYVYPALGFALWHLAPQTVIPSSYPGGRLSFVGGAGVWGLLYGWVAWHTRSIRWTTASHVLLDALGLGGAIYVE